MKGRQVVITEYRKPFEIREFDVPDPEPGDTVVRITQAGICGSDLHTWRGDTEQNPIPPQGRAMGHEGTGVVYKLGEGVTADALGNPLKEGDRVIHTAIMPCNHCPQCLRGDHNLCVSRTPRMVGDWPYFIGTYADYYYVTRNQPLFKVPDELSDDLLSPVNCAMGTVTQGLTVAGVHEGQAVVIQGAGGLGLTAIAMAKDMGADRVIVLDRLENRLELAEEFGADHTINIEEYNTPETRVARVRELTRGRGADIVVELVGYAPLLTEGLEMLTNGGTFLEIGLFFRGQTIEFDPSAVVLTGKRIVGSVMYKPTLMSTILDFLVRNRSKLPFDKMVSHKFPLADVNDAFEQSEWSQRQTAISRAVLVP
jgi:D-arabinose 1-dehydrogenase-like Zn-dependent alcohol dehydrogenase